MNDKKTISVYLQSSFLLEIDNFVKANNIASRGDFICAAARYYMDNFNKVSMEDTQDSNIKPMEESPSSSFHKVLLETIESSNRNLIEKLDILIEHIQFQNTLTKVPDESRIDILSKINNNLEELLATFIDNKSSKIPEIKQPTDLLTAIPIEDTWEEENSQEDCAQYVDKDGNLLTPEEYQKTKEEHDKYMEEFELQRKFEKQAHEVELRNQIKPMPHYTHLETYKDENSVIYQETYKQYQLRYNTIRTKNLQTTFELLNYMAPVLKTEKIYREFLEKIDAAESSNDKHLWQRAGGYNNYNLQKHLESLAAAQAQYPTHQKLNLPNFIPYTIQEEKTPKKAIVWDV